MCAFVFVDDQQNKNQFKRKPNKSRKKTPPNWKIKQFHRLMHCFGVYFIRFLNATNLFSKYWFLISFPPKERMPPHVLDSHIYIYCLIIMTRIRPCWPRLNMQNHDGRKQKPCKWHVHCMKIGGRRTAIENTMEKHQQEK